MTVMIAYGSIEGQTGKIARYVDKLVKAAGFETQLIDTADPMVAAPLDKASHVILAAPVHERRHPKPFEVFVEAQRKDLAAPKTLVLSVSLKAAFEDGQEEAQDYLTEMLMRTDFEPDETLLVAGAVRPEAYGYFETEVVRHVVLRDQQVDPSDGVREFTDWDALKDKVTAFLKE
ncbi:flavodoxin domain-containing protein [Actibacterium pelagium]|uniref:Flavodoxin-like domain-containing protein n=1 Tax=Actibacterium pelagium TaxID=2029103 RepID=A0A917ABD1_9RHOB|nr:flavodoxin domain-containing protein [Actibacterium pelagium]GGE36779.1 hypothetical protein GCM10011517_00620 [Actibacterium pelagium]